MKNFAELAKIVTNYKSKKVDLLYGEPGNQDNKYQKLASALAENANMEEEEAEEIVGAGRGSSTFRMFRLRFREKLLNSLLFSEIELKTNYSRTIALLSRNVYCIRILLLISARASAIELAEQTLKKAMEFEIADIALYCCSILRQHQKHIGNITGFEHYKNLYNQYEEIQHAENKAAEYFDSFILLHAGSNLFKMEDLDRLSGYLSEIKLLKEKYHTYHVGLNYYRVTAIYHFGSQNYATALEVWNEAIAFLEGYKNFEYDTRLGEILMHKMLIFFYLHDYPKGLDCAEQCKAIFMPGTNNWFLYNEILFLLALHTHNYAQAGKVLEQVINAPQLKFQMDNIKERWRIFEAYYFILLKAGVAPKYANSRFRFSSFLNSLTIHTKDKKGYNTSILIVEMMYHLLNKEFHIMTEKMDALKRYSKRHFNDNANYRSEIFLKMLIDCEKYEYKKDVIVKKTRKMHEKLISIQLSYVSSLDGIEIVPFADLWNIVCDNLE